MTGTQITEATNSLKALWQFARSLAAHFGFVTVGLANLGHLPGTQRLIVSAVTGLVALADHVQPFQTESKPSA